MNDIFSRPKKSDDCLSMWQISQVDLGIMQRSTFAAHLDGCEHCRGLLQAESSARRAAAAEAVPDALKSRRKKPRFAFIFGGAGVFAASAAALFIFLQPGEGIRTKGELALSLSVMRGQASVYTNEPAERVHDLRPGDRIQLHTRPGFVVLEVWDENAWQEAFAGQSDGVLPIALTITPDGDTKLRVRHCQSSARKKCDERELRLQ